MILSKVRRIHDRCRNVEFDSYGTLRRIRFRPPVMKDTCGVRRWEWAGRGMNSRLSHVLMVSLLDSFNHRSDWHMSYRRVRSGL